MYICGMKTLVIHPKDKSTEFLRSIYNGIPYKTIITGGCSRKDIIEEINRHDRVIMLGHGSGQGLFSVGQFTNNLFVIDKELVTYLKQKECVFIWCNSDRFVGEHNLNGFYSGMFISELSESEFCGFQNIEQEEVDFSNYTFSGIVGKYINSSLSSLYYNVKNEYGVFVDTNPIVRYNHNRLYYKTKDTIKDKFKFVEKKFGVLNN